MERAHRIGSYLLPLFALLWLGAILGTDFSHPPYSIDANLRRQGSDVLVTAVGPAAARAGLRVGDVIVFSRATNLRFSAGQLGTPFTLQVRRAGRVFALTVPMTRPRVPDALVVIILSDTAITFALLLAAYLGFRKPGVMVTALILFLGGGALSWPAFAAYFSSLPDAIFVPFATVLAALCDWFPVMALASFAIRLPGDPPSARQKMATRIVDGVVIIAFLVALLPQFPSLYIACAALSGLVLILASLAALEFARPAARARAGIVFAGVMIGGVGYAVNMIGVRLGEPFWLFTIYAVTSVVVVPLSLAYAILRHRVFDVSFVLNRTIVYALTSALVLVLFSALEFLVERFLNDVTRVEGIVLQFGVALVVIVSVRFLHQRADLIVDSVLFRSRHEQESALRRFAITLQFYTDEPALIRDTIDMLQRYGRVQGAAVYVSQDEGLRQLQSSFPVASPAIDQNDTAYVDLRAHREPLHVHGTPTAFPGDRLYPMIRAGRIVGVIATGERESGEAMPPDIDDAIKRITDAAAAALGTIESDEIRTELTALRAQLAIP